MIKKKGNLHFIPSNLYYPIDVAATQKMGLDELAIKMQDSIEYMGILKEIIDNIEDNYIIKDKEGQTIQNTKFDYIFIDCPPANNIITKGAFLVADYFAIPTILDGVSTNGVVHYIETVAGTYNQYCRDSEEAILYRHVFGKRPKLLGIFYTFIRGQANYDEDRRNFGMSLDEAKSKAEDSGERDVAELLGKEYIMASYINNYVDIARSIAIGSKPWKTKDYEKLTQEIYNKLKEGD